jgi:ATP-binding cassette subfamily B protein
MPLVTVAVVFVMRYVHQRATRVQEGFATLTTRVRESLTGIRVVKAFHREASQEAIFEDASNDYLEANMSLARVQRLFLPAMTLFAGSAIALVLWRGGLLVMAGTISLGDFVAFTGYLGLLMWPMAALGWTVNLFQRGAASWERIQQLLDTEMEPLVEEGSPPGGSGLVEFDRVSLRRGEREILHDVSVSIAPGSVVAIVGPTGAGKSTLLKLLARLLPPTDGVIRLDGVPLAEWNLPQLRRALSFVPQEAFLFSESIAKNIELGRPGTERQELLAAAELAALTDEVDAFTDGLDSVVGERGVALSGGQRQRATLARALLRHPRVLVLDDAFSNMDTKTEERILGRLPTHFRGTTVLLVSHRLSTVRRADRILYLDEGRIQEDGSHEALLRRGGRYASFVRRQRLLEELESTSSDSGEAA